MSCLVGESLDSVVEGVVACLCERGIELVL